jgi:signal recognition particle subunit SRP54
VTERACGADVLEALSPAQMVIKIVNEELCALMGSENQKLNISSKSPSVVMLVGLQGAGKTTNGAKLAGYMRKQGKRPLLAACDIYRPAAIDQLETWARQLDIPCSRWGRRTPWTSPRPPWSTPKSTATTWCFWIPPAACTSTRS